MRHSHHLFVQRNNGHLVTYAWLLNLCGLTMANLAISRLKVIVIEHFFVSIRSSIWCCNAHLDLGCSSYMHSKSGIKTDSHVCFCQSTHRVAHSAEGQEIDKKLKYDNMGAFSPLLAFFILLDVTIAPLELIARLS